MTSHKPFTAEQLDRKVEAARSNGLIDDGVMAQDWFRLIAQAREEIRLREELRVSAAQTLNLSAELVRLYQAEHEPDHLIPREPVVQIAMRLSGIWARESPAARAKRELGQWLVADYNRAFHVDHNNGEFQCRLWEMYDGETPYSYSGVGKDPTEAITAALRAAKEKP